MNRLLWSLLILSALFLTALPPGRAEGEKPLKPNLDMNAVVQGNNAFAGDLYARLARKDGNLFFSPYSISTALAMTYAGAQGQTAEQMAHTLHYPVERARLDPAFANLIRALQGDGTPRKFQLNTANSLWGQSGYHFKPPFLDILRDDYAAGLREVDFHTAAEPARLAINRWVEQQTQDKIKDLIAPGLLGPATRLVLVNAIYFKGAWSEAFRKENTKPEDFHLADRTNVTVPMMHKVEGLSYFDEGSFQMVELPYQGGQQSTLIFLPKDASGLAEFEKKLTAQNMDAWRTKMQHYIVDLALPRFKMTAEFELSKTLASMGIPLAFDSSKADFSGMTQEEKLWIDAIVHKAFVDVNEAGTEAAAATAVMMKAAGIAQAMKRATFKADHPFVFAIRENQTGSVLFMGRVAKPQG
jgi:serpin B